MSSVANPYPEASDEHFMYEALRLARRGLGWTAPNPPVGCVLVRNGQIVGRGWHRTCGGLHAETAALEDCDAPAGTTAYVTLEPCSHVGRQPACTDELSKAGVVRVVYGCEDADPRSARQALPLLRSQGMEVTAGVLRSECEALLLPYLFSKREQRPHVHLKLALSLDGKIACANGASQWLSGPESLGLAHYLRQQYDAVMVGRGTVLADDPRLTVREEVLRNFMDIDGLNLRDPVRIVVDPQLRLIERLAELRLARPGNQRPDLPQLVIVTAEGQRQNSPASQLAQLPVKAEVVTLASHEGVLDLTALPPKLWALGITSVLVEGGGRLISELLRQHAANHLTLVYTPLLLGSDALGFTPQFGLRQVGNAPRLTLDSVRRLGNDTVVNGRLAG